MADEKRAQAAEPEEQATPARKKLMDNKALMLGAIVVAQALLALGITHFYVGPRLQRSTAAAQAALAGGAGVPGAESEPKLSGIIVPLQEIVVTLQSAAAPRYLKIAVHLEVSDQKTARQIEARMPQLRDMAIMTLSAKSAEELGTPAGKEEVRQEIRQRLGALLPERSLQNVYFSDLVIQ